MNSVELSLASLLRDLPTQTTDIEALRRLRQSDNGAGFAYLAWLEELTDGRAPSREISDWGEVFEL